MKATDRSIGTLRGRAPRQHAGRLATATPRRAARWVAAAALALLLTACSTLQLGYNQADTATLFALDRYLDLDESQERLARQQTRALLAWHRTDQLPAYARWLEDAQRSLGGRVSPAQVLALQARTNAAFAAVGEQAAPKIAALALTLRPAQIERLAKRMAENTAEAQREQARLTADAAAEERADTFLDRVDSWFGSVTPEQKRIVRANASAAAQVQAWRLEQRTERERSMIAVLTRIQSEHPDPAVATQWIRAYFAALAQPRDAQAERMQQQSRMLNAELIAQLVNAATPEQRAHLLARLHGYANDVAQLAAEPLRG